MTKILFDIQITDDFIPFGVRLMAVVGIGAKIGVYGFRQQRELPVAHDGLVDFAVASGIYVNGGRHNIHLIHLTYFLKKPPIHKKQMEGR